MTLLELTVIILVLLSLITILFVGAKAWKRGSDRAACILQHRLEHFVESDEQLPWPEVEFEQAVGAQPEGRHQTVRKVIGREPAGLRDLGDPAFDTVAQCLEPRPRPDLPRRRRPRPRRRRSTPLPPPRPG